MYEKANANIIICLDGDTTINEVKRIYRVLDRGRLRGRIKYIRLDTKEIPYKDFGEIYEAEGRRYYKNNENCTTVYRNRNVNLMKK